MAVTLITHGKLDATGTPVTSSAVDTSGANLIVIGVTTNGAVASNAITDNKGNTWLTLTPPSGTARNGMRMFYAKNAIVGSGHTFTDTPGSGNGSMVFAAFGGLIVDPFDSSASGSSGAGATSLNAGLIVPALPLELLVTCCTIDDPAGNTMACTGFIVTDTFDVVVGATFGISMAYQIQGAAASINPQWTRTTANAQTGDLGQVLSFKSPSLSQGRAVSYQQRRAA